MGTISHTTDIICGEGADLKEPSVSGNDNARLLAIVEVERDQRVRCGNPGCGHSVHKAIHVVQEGSQLLVLGSTCFSKRYGTGALGKPHYRGGAGRTLDAEERELLLTNTAALLKRFECEREAARKKFCDLKAAFAARRASETLSQSNVFSRQTELSAWAGIRNTAANATVPKRSPPWAWMKPRTSMASFKLTDGSGWVRVQHVNGRQMLAPWPEFDGWDEWLPGHLGRPELSLGAYEVTDIFTAIAFLRSLSTRERVSGIWSEVHAELTTG